MGEDADVAAVGDGHPRLQGADEHLAGFLDARRLGLAGLPAGIAGDRVRGGEGGDQRDPLLLHQGEQLGGDVRAVLDRLHPGEHGAADPLLGVGVGGDGEPGAPRLVHRGGHLLLREGGSRDARTAAVVGVDLDPVGAGGDLLAHGLAHLDGTVHHLRPLRDLPARIEAGRTVGAGGDQRARGGEDARPGDHAGGDRVAQGDVREARPLGAEVAHGSEARLQGGLRRHHAADRPQLERLFQDLVVPGGLVIGVEEEMRVHLDQPGDQGQSREIDPPRSGRRLDRAGGADRGDPAVLDQHVAPVEEALAGGIEDPGAGQQERSGSRRRGDGEDSKKEDRDRCGDGLQW